MKTYAKNAVLMLNVNKGDNMSTKKEQNKPLFKHFHGKYYYAFKKMRRLSLQGYVLVRYKLNSDNTYTFGMRRGDFRFKGRKVK